MTDAPEFALIMPGSPGLTIPGPGGMVPYVPFGDPIPSPDALAVLVDTCPDGQGGHCGCDGETPRDCARPGRPAKVSRAWCYPCQAGTWADGAPQP